MRENSKSPGLAALISRYCSIIGVRRPLGSKEAAGSVDSGMVCWMVIVVQITKFCPAFLWDCGCSAGFPRAYVPSLPGLTRQSIRFAKTCCEGGWIRGSSPRMTRRLLRRPGLEQQQGPASKAALAGHDLN